MLILAGFLESLLHGTVLVALCLTLGSVAWALAVLRAGREPRPALDARCLRVFTIGALTLAVSPSTSRSRPRSRSESDAVADAPPTAIAAVAST